MALTQKIKAFFKEWSDIMLIMLAAIGIRAYYLYKFEMWFDEAFTGILMRVPQEEFMKVLMQDTNPPAFYVFTKFWTLLFGTGEIALRTFPLLAGVATVFLAYIIGKKLFDKETGVIAAALLAISPFMVQYSIEARTYALYGLFTLLSFYTLFTKKYFFFALFTAFLPFLHYAGIFYSVLLLGIFVLKQLIDKTYADKKTLIVSIAIGAFVLASVFFSYKNAISKTEVLNDGWVKQPTVLNIKKSTYSYLFGVRSKQPGTDEALNLKTRLPKKHIETVVVVIFAGFLVVALAKKPAKEELFKLAALLTLTFVPLVFTILTAKVFEVNLYVERYLFPSGVFFIITFAYLLKKTLQFEIMLMVLLAYAFLVFARLEQPKYYFGMRNLTSTHRNTVNYVTFTSPMDYVIGRYYFGEQYGNIRLYDPKDPTQKYVWWPFVREEHHKVPTKNSLLVVPDEGRLDNPDIYVRRKEHGSYVIYTLLPSVDLESKLQETDSN